MTPGDALALVTVAAAVAVAMVTRGHFAAVACAVALGIVAARLCVWYAPGGWRLIGTAAVWLVVASFAVRCAATADAESRQLATTAALISLSALCYPVAWAIAAPAQFGSLPFVLADLALWVALVGVWRGGRSVGLDRSGNLGSPDRRRAGDPVGGLGAAAAPDPSALIERY